MDERDKDHTGPDSADDKAHFELSPHDQDEAEDGDGAEGRSEPEARPRAEAKPLLQLQEDKCPKCGMALRHDAVFCIKCGYDLRTNEVRTAQVGVEHVAEPPAPDANDFSKPGRGGIGLLVGIGGAITVGAMVMAGLRAPPSFAPTAASIVLCLYEVALHTGTGLIAILIAARVSEMKPGRLDLAAARIFVAFAAFQLIHSITFGEYRLLVTLLMYPLAMATYWGVVMLLFRKPRMVALLVLISHFVLWVLVQMGMSLSAYVGEVSARPPAVVAPAHAGDGTLPM